MLDLGLSTVRPVCNPVQSQASQVCFTGARSVSLGDRRPESSMGESGCLCFPPSISAQPSDLQGDGSGLSQNDSNRSGVAQHALVLGPGQSISSDSLPTATSEGSGDATLQRPRSQEPQSSESVCLAPRTSAIQEQGFTDEVAARIEAPQRLSTRAVYKSKWAIFTPQPLWAVGVLFSPMVSGWAGGQASCRVGGQREKVCPGYISETVRCRKLILGRDIG